jgi:hypothetical protein
MQLEPDYAVIVAGRSRGSGWTGRIGMTKTKLNGYWTVQFGADGPFYRIKETSLRYATTQEIKNADMYGVGFKIWDNG